VTTATNFIPESPKMSGGLWTESGSLVSKPSAPPSRRIRFVFAHGFTQVGRHWQPFIEALRRTAGEATTEQSSWMTLDLPGHGRSSHLRFDLTESGAAVERAASGERSSPLGPEHDLTSGPADTVGTVLVGYSLGARTALHTALLPQLTTLSPASPPLQRETPTPTIRALIFIGGTPGLRSEEERDQRRHADAALCERMRTHGLDKFLDFWLSQPLFATLPVSPIDRQLRLTNEVDGLCRSLTGCGTGAQLPLWEYLPDIHVPTLLLTGDRDTKFGAIAEEMKPLISGHTDHVRVADSGHACHTEQPEATATAIWRFLQQTL
jgi:2-succinyl-6-hydroxy-2,4-cyclohexadiene-1-carboxylate synthase